MKVRWIKWYADEWLSGTATLKSDERGVYITICNLIYSHGGPIPDDEKDLASLCGCNWRSFRRIREVLIARRKIFSEDGQIMVKRCAKELQDAFTMTANAVQNGRKGGRPSNKNNDITKPAGFFPEKLTRTRTRTRTKEEDSGANAPDAALAPSGPESAPVKAFWTNGVTYLVSNGVEEKTARSLIGKWRREFGEAAVMAAIARSKEELATEPISFISACLQQSRNGRNGTNGHGRRYTPAQEHSIAGLQAIWDADREEDLRNSISVTRSDSS